MKVLTLLLLTPAVLAHVCMWSPMQRGKFSVSTPGESACYLKEGPCGGVASGDVLTTVNAGQKFNILFRQNLNHFYIENPGKLAADIAYSADPAEADFVPLGDLNDYNAMNEITQTNFSLAVTVPQTTSDHAVIRLRYLSENPTENDRGTIFYQCADVKIVSAAASEEKEVSKEVPAASVKDSDKSYDCCAAGQFTLQGYETSSWRNPTSKSYYFDKEHLLFRVDTVSGKGTTPRDGHFQMISNFSSGIEYYYNVHANTCDLYGLNYWSDWCYGAVNNQRHHTSLKIGNELADVWSLPGDNDVFRWTNARDSCVPVSMNRVDSGEVTYFFDFKEGAPDASVFTLPSACIRKEAELLGKGKLPASPHSHMRL